MTQTDTSSPDPHVLADEDDELDWDVDRDGRMQDHAADDDAVTTHPLQPAQED